MAVTIREIARRAGVSRGTVDRVLHNRNGVNEETAMRIRAIAKELGFTPNLAGKALATRKQPLRIGCLLPSLGNPFFLDVIEGFKQAERDLSDFGVSVDILEVKSFEPSEHLWAIGELERKAYDALCLTTIDVEPVNEAITRLLSQGTTVVTVNTDISSADRLFYIGPDYYHQGTIAAGLLSLVGTAEQHMLVVTGSFNIKGHNERIQGFLKGLESLGISYRILGMVESLDDDNISYQRTMEKLSGETSINCVYLAAAGVLGACNAVRDAGRQKKIRILSYDDIPSTRELVREGIITFTLCQEPYRQGYDAIQKLFYHLMNQQDPVNDTITKTIIKIRENVDD